MILPNVYLIYFAFTIGRVQEAGVYKSIKLRDNPQYPAEVQGKKDGKGT